MNRQYDNVRRRLIEQKKRPRPGLGHDRSTYATTLRSYCWAAHGLQGLQGLQGFFAAQGLQGLQGLQGFAAAHGLQGLHGFAAAHGLQGLQVATWTKSDDVVVDLAIASGRETNEPALAIVATPTAAIVFFNINALS